MKKYWYFKKQSVSGRKLFLRGIYLFIKIPWVIYHIYQHFVWILDLNNIIVFSNHSYTYGMLTTITCMELWRIIPGPNGSGSREFVWYFLVLLHFSLEQSTCQNLCIHLPSYNDFTYGTTLRTVKLTPSINVQSRTTVFIYLSKASEFLYYSPWVQILDTFCLVKIS